MKKIVKFALAATTLLAFSCSSAPKRSMIVSTVYNSATGLLESANSNILNGNYEKADFLLTQAKNQAMSVDNYDLLTSVLLARVSLNLSYAEPDIEGANLALAQAKEYAKYSDFSEKQSALCVLSEVRITTIAAADPSSNLNSLLTKLEDNKKAIKGDAYNEAHFETAAGDIYKLQKNYPDAEASYTRAVKIFTDECYLSEIGISWYKIAQIRSLQGNKNGALTALENAIHYDRLAENSLALGTDYYVKGIVLLKGNPSQTEKDTARYAFQHSADIFEAAGFPELAERSRNQL